MSSNTKPSIRTRLASHRYGSAERSSRGRSTRRRSAELDQARLEGVQLAVRTLTHHINNGLALTVGYCELLAAAPDLPEPLRSKALLALQGAEQAAQTLQAMHRITRLRPDTSVEAIEPLLLIPDGLEP